MSQRLRSAYVQTPFRISFFGGGTDFPEFFNRHRGAIIGTSINRYSYVALNQLERIKDNIIKLTYSRLEVVKRLEDIEHPIVRCVLDNHREFIGDNFLDIHSFADLPSKSGIGSSSAFTVGLLQAFYTLLYQYHSPGQLAMEAIDIERNKLGDAGGWQDQIMCAFGGFNHVEFKDNAFSVEQIVVNSEIMTELEHSLMFFYTQEQRSSNVVQKMTFSKQNIKDKEQYLLEMLDTVNDCLALLRSGRSTDLIIQDFGKLLDETWKLKRSLSSGISSPYIDSLYAGAVSAGALGGKVCGAGGGGFMFFCVPPEAQSAVRDRLSGLGAIEIPVRFSDKPSKVLFVSNS